ncbi:hypothetical protein RGQ29_023979 [Quercus rubra]|uniref:Uncharacterized protein n=1 Tax=Quercus rubra TaxID=3512 RepID=A0AAN7IUV3_QUERU|nr:hypothetical protein RGQ29_023979 [Quercus rubra]
MATKLVLFVSVMVAALALPIAKGTSVEVQVGPSFVPCSINCSLGVNVTATPAFPNAQVQLQCGAIAVATTTTNASGVFSFSLDFTQVFLSARVGLSNCNLVVITPLSTCNPTLPPVGVLTSSIVFVRTDVLGVRVVLIFRAVGFRYIPPT